MELARTCWRKSNGFTSLLFLSFYTDTGHFEEVEQAMPHRMNRAADDLALSLLRKVEAEFQAQGISSPDGPYRPTPMVAADGDGSAVSNVEIQRRVLSVTERRQGRTFLSSGLRLVRHTGSVLPSRRRLGQATEAVRDAQPHL
jgi:hypothetical protein